MVFVVDVSASIDKELFERPIKRYIKQLVKDFYLQEDIDKLSTKWILFFIFISRPSNQTQAHSVLHKKSGVS